MILLTVATVGLTAALTMVASSRRDMARHVESLTDLLNQTSAKLAEANERHADMVETIDHLQSRVSSVASPPAPEIIVPNPATLPTDHLSAVFAAQEELQLSAYGIDVASLETSTRVEYIKHNVLALLDEVHETLREVGWKPWSQDAFINEEAARDELADVMLFVTNLCLALRLSPGDLRRRVEAKQDVNRQRAAARDAGETNTRASRPSLIGHVPPPAVMARPEETEDEPEDERVVEDEPDPLGDTWVLPAVSEDEMEHPSIFDDMVISRSGIDDTVIETDEDYRRGIDEAYRRILA